MMRTRRSLALVLAATLLAGACVGKGRNAPAPQERATVRVENQAWMDVDVFALYSGTRARLGTVTANSSATFRIPPAVVGMGRELQFMVDPVGSSRQGVSFNMYVRPGEEIRLTVPPSLGR
jgi:hypothetical protein